MFNVSKITSNKEHSQTASILVFIRRKLLSNQTDYFEELMVNMVHSKTRVNDGFGVSKVMTSTRGKEEDNEHGKPPKNSKM